MPRRCAAQDDGVREYEQPLYPFGPPGRLEPDLSSTLLAQSFTPPDLNTLRRSSPGPTEVENEHAQSEAETVETAQEELTERPAPRSAPPALPERPPLPPHGPTQDEILGLWPTHSDPGTATTPSESQDSGYELETFSPRTPGRPDSLDLMTPTPPPAAGHEIVPPSPSGASDNPGILWPPADRGRDTTLYDHITRQIVQPSAAESVQLTASGHYTVNVNGDVVVADPIDPYTFVRTNPSLFAPLHRPSAPNVLELAWSQGFCYYPAYLPHFSGNLFLRWIDPSGATIWSRIAEDANDPASLFTEPRHYAVFHPLFGRFPPNFGAGNYIDNTNGNWWVRV
ncbi:MAG: hypothetical protein Q9159_003623 [Coniocarpon cinnabarinum]